MGFMDRMLSSMKMIPDDVELEEFEDEDEGEVEEVTTSVRKKPITRGRSVVVEEPEEAKEKRMFFSGKKNTYESDTVETESTNIVSVEPTRKPVRSVRNLPAAQGQKLSEVKMITPLTYDEAKDIVELLLEGKTVVLNLERIKVDLGQKIIDFTAGACYTMGGDMQSISKKIFIATPSNVELSGDFTNILTGNGTMDFSMLNLNT